MDKIDINMSWNYFSSSHGKEIVDLIGRTLKGLVGTEILGNARVISAKDFVDVCRLKTKTIIVSLIEQVQLEKTRILLEKMFEKNYERTKDSITALNSYFT